MCAIVCGFYLLFFFGVIAVVECLVIYNSIDGVSEEYCVNPQVDTENTSVKVLHMYAGMWLLM